MPMNFPKPAAAVALEGPLARHLRELSEGSRPFPTTAARRHHFVPSFSLAKFATPAKRNGNLFQLDVTSGRPSKTTPDESAFIEELYSQQVEEGQNRALEAYLSVVENYAAPAIGRLLDRPLDLNPKDRQTISYYLAFQYQRTPVVIEHSIANSQVVMELLMSVEFASEEGFKKMYREKIDASVSDQEIAELRHRTQAALQNGEVTFSDPKGQAFRLMLSTTDEVAKTIFNMDWVILQAIEDGFVTSDRGIAMHDPTPKFPWSGHALASSPSAETTFPLDPTHTLLLHRGSQGLATADVERAAVRELNLRIYGWATDLIFGDSQEALQRVRRDAKRYPHLVVKPRTPKHVLLEPADPKDPSVGSENVKKGWPRGVMIPGEKGEPTFAAYTVIDPKAAGAGAAAVTGNSVAQRVAKSARQFDNASRRQRKRRSGS
jgi:hypothetical protein